jgi:hypothetical protein
LEAADERQDEEDWTYWKVRPPAKRKNQVDTSRRVNYPEGSIPGTTKKKVVGLERSPLSLVSTTEELLDRKVAAPV